MPEYKSFRGPVSPEATLRWAWDLDGYTVIRAAAAFVGAPPTQGHAVELAEQPPAAVAERIALLCGTAADLHGQASTGPEWDGWDGQDETMPIEYVLDSPPSYLRRGGAGGARWVGEIVDPVERRRLEYNIEDRPPNNDHVASVLGLRLVYCTPPSDITRGSEAAGAQSRKVLVAPASHKGKMSAPTPDIALAMGALVQVELCPGDCLLSAATTLVALPPCEPEDDERSAGLLQIMLAEASVANPNWSEAEVQTPGESGPAHSPAMDRTSGTGSLSNNSAVTGDGACVDPAELWFWDTLGYLVIPNVMDAAWLAAANDVLDPHTGVERVEVPLDEELMTSDECSALITPIDGRHEVRVRSPLELPGALGDPFRKMLCCEAVNRRLEWILAPGFTVTGSYAIVSQFGAAGQRMHAGPWYNWGHHYRSPRSGCPPLRSPGLNLGWALRDVNTDLGDGGVMIIPGSHKMRRPIPLPPTQSCDLPQVRHINFKAGDVIIYMGGQTTHGVKAWRADHERRFVATKVSLPRRTASARL